MAQISVLLTHLNSALLRDDLTEEQDTAGD